MVTSRLRTAMATAVAASRRVTRLPVLGSGGGKRVWTGATGRLAAWARERGPEMSMVTRLSVHRMRASSTPP
jgi:hypothetical protein